MTEAASDDKTARCIVSENWIQDDAPSLCSHTALSGTTGGSPPER